MPSRRGETEWRWRDERELVPYGIQRKEGLSIYWYWKIRWGVGCGKKNGGNAVSL